MAETNTGGVVEKAGDMFGGIWAAVKKHPYITAALGGLLGGQLTGIGKGKGVLMALAGMFFISHFQNKGAEAKTADTPKTETPVADKDTGKTVEQVVKENPVDVPAAKGADVEEPPAAQPQVIANQQPDTTKQVNH